MKRSSHTPNGKTIDEKVLIDPRLWWFTTEEQSELIDLLRVLDHEAELDEEYTKEGDDARTRLVELVTLGRRRRGTLRPVDVASDYGLSEGEIFRLILRGELTPIFGKNDYGKWIDVYEGECRQWVDENLKSESRQDLKRRELIGYAPVDSGLLLIIDPCYIAEEWKQASLHQIVRELTETGGQILDGLAVATSTRSGDGIFPVFAEYGNDGEIERVVIDFLAPSISQLPRRDTGSPSSS